MWLDEIDRTFVINLPERTDRKELVTKELNEQQIPFEIYAATKNEKGAYGLFETLDGLFQMCEREGYKNILLFEDDVEFIRTDTHEIMNKVFEQIKDKDFDLLYLGGNLWKPNEAKFVSDNLLSVSFMYALHSVIFSSSGIKKMNEIIYKIKSNQLPFKPIDVYVERLLEKDGQSYCAYPFLTTQRESFSNIENKHVNYQFIHTRYGQIRP